MVQSDSLGTSIAQTLVVHADEMRNRRTMRAEELAYTLPVKLSITLVIFILPCIVTVVLLPGIIGIVRKLLPALGGGGGETDDGDTQGFFGRACPRGGPAAPRWRSGKD